MIKNMVGLEAEFLLYDKDGTLVMPREHGFEVDDYPILGEFRAKPGESIGKTVGNFITEYYNVIAKADKLGLTVDLSGHSTISPELYAKVLTSMGTKTLAKGANIYGGNILTMSDHVIDESGNITAVKISCGLHLHFSSNHTVSRVISGMKYTPVTLPLSIKDIPVQMDLYRGAGYEEERTITATADRITNPVVKFIVEQLDTLVYPLYKLDVALKYRRPGYYELKPYGFEYRSLPFTSAVLNNIMKITTTAFELLESI